MSGEWTCQCVKDYRALVLAAIQNGYVEGKFRCAVSKFALICTAPIYGMYQIPAEEIVQYLGIVRDCGVMDLELN
jgi:hypothetical protein